MCGIAGIVGIETKAKAQAVIEKMTARIAHRGPDASDFFVDEEIALGHRRLAIIDLSDDGIQPVTDASGRYTLVFNGEIYNYRTLRALSSHKFKTETDTEVLLALLIERGVDCLQLLNGMFSFAFWDSEKKELLCARDRLGIKPFFYAHDGEKFLFASEVRPILESGFVSRKINRESLNDYLAYQTAYAPDTLLKDVSQLQGGEFGIFKSGKFEINRYWSVEKIENEEPVLRPMETVRKTFFESVERRMISDVPLGAFLSGGIDSSAIVAAMAQISTDKVNTFSVVFDEKEFDESPYSDLMAKKFNTHHQKIRLKPTSFTDNLEEALDAMDQPSADGINSFVICGETKKAGLTVALSGLGGDEIFAGYAYFHNWKKLTGLKHLWLLPQFLRKGGAGILPMLSKKQGARMKKMFSTPDFSTGDIYPFFRQVSTAQEYLSKEAISKDQFSGVSKILKNIDGSLDQLPSFSQISVAELLSYTQNVLLKDADQMSMAHALEVRVPFLDHEMVDLMIRVSDEDKYQSYPKDLLVKSLSPLLPDEIVHRPKMGFTFPWKFWLKNELKSFCEKRLMFLQRYSIFDFAKINKMWLDFLGEKEDVSWVKIWQLVVLSYWMEKNKIEE